MGELSKKVYQLDNSGIIHLAAIKKNHTNSFRFTATLTEEIRQDILQETLNRIVARFPTIVAGIKNGFFRHAVVPVQTTPKVIPDKECLAYMAKKEIENCAFRVLYGERKISVEIFHSLTDGYGGITFLNTLLAEYLKLQHGIITPNGLMVLEPSHEPQKEEVSDDYFTYAGEEKAPLKQRRVYQLPGQPEADGKIRTTTYVYNVRKLLDTAHRYGVSLNTFLTTVMAKTIIEIQKRHSKTGRCEKPVQIMIPANLRKIFPSKTLRNFSLFATPCIEAPESGGSFDELLSIVAKQLKEQLTKEQLSAVMATNTRLEKMPLVKMVPLSLKCLILKIVHHLIGEQTSCITFSNLGTMPMPEVLAPYVEKVEVLLTPRISSPYNCGMITYGEKCYINFTRLCKEPELEKCFFDNLSSLVVS